MANRLSVRASSTQTDMHLCVGHEDKTWRMMDKHVPCQRSLQYKYGTFTLPLKVSVKTAPETYKMDNPSQDTPSRNTPPRQNSPSRQDTPPSRGSPLNRGSPPSRGAPPSHGTSSQQSAVTQPHPLGVVDLRQQILSNALAIFPHIVDKHTKKYPNTPVRAEDIFDVCIILGDCDRAIFGPYYAQLRHADGEIPAIRKLLIGTSSFATAEEALRVLLESTAALLHVESRLAVSRGNGMFPVPDLPIPFPDLPEHDLANSLAQVHTTTITEARNFVENYVAEAQSTGSVSSPETLTEVQRTKGMKSPGALWKKFKKVIPGRQACEA
jgi:hypothetical protein